jgi:hypothetical protein
MERNKIMRCGIFVISIAGLIACITLLFPHIRVLIISLAEEFLVHRKLNQEAWMRTLHTYARMGITCIVIFDVFVLTVHGRLLVNNIKSAIKSCLKEIRFKVFVKPFLLMSGVYLLGIITIIRANYLYEDDLGRTIKGNQGWSNWSRYLSDIVSTFIHTNIFLNDISPLPQIFAVLFLAASSVFMVYSLCDKKMRVTTLLASIPVGLSPYFLSCLSYKFDSPYMALSVLASIVPFLCTGSRLAFIASSIAGLLVMCMTYQASSGIYPLLVIILCFQDWNYKRKPYKEILRFALTALLSFVFTMLLFRLYFMRPSDSYVSTAMFPLSQMFSGIINNIKQYAVFIYHDFAFIWKIGIMLVIACFILQTVKRSKQNRLIASLGTVFLIILLFILSYGVYLALEKPLFSPRALYGCGIFFAIIMICLVSYRGKISAAFVILISWCFLVFAFSYGNALADQKRYIDFRAELLLDDLNGLFPNRTIDDMPIQLEGTAGFAPSIKSIAKQYPVIERLVACALSENSVWGYYYLLEYFNWGNINLINEEWNQINNIDFTVYNFPTVLDTYYHIIKSDGARILVILK